MTTTITCPRYDLCPNCSSRVNIHSEELLDLPDLINGLLHIENTRLFYKGDEIKLVNCTGCGATMERQYILDYWANYYLDKDID